MLFRYLICNMFILCQICIFLNYIFAKYCSQDFKISDLKNNFFSPISFFCHLLSVRACVRVCALCLLVP